MLALRAVANSYRWRMEESRQIALVTFHRHCFRYQWNFRRMRNMCSRFTVSLLVRVPTCLYPIGNVHPFLRVCTYRGSRKHFWTTDETVKEETNTDTAGACRWTDPFYTLSPSPLPRRVDDLSLGNRTCMLALVS